MGSKKKRKYGESLQNNKNEQFEKAGRPIQKAILFLWKALWLVSVTIVPTLQIYLTKIGVEPGDPIKTSVLSTPFRIKNEGFTSMASVRFQCTIREATTGNGGIILNSQTGVERLVPILISGESTTSYCSETVEYSVAPQFADIEIVTYYRSRILGMLTLPFDWESRVRFRTRSKQGGGVYWESRSLTESDIAPNNLETILY